MLLNLYGVEEELVKKNPEALNYFIELLKVVKLKMDNLKIK